MKMTMRILFGIVGLIAIILGVRQMSHGFQEMSGTSAKTPQVLGERVSIAQHGCALVVPKGWEQKDASQGGIMFVAPKASGYVANFIVASEPFPRSLRDYADATITAVKAAAPNAKLGADSAFAPASGAPSYKISFRNKVNDVEIAQSMYFFDGPPGHKIVITSTASAPQTTDLEPLFDGSMKTLTISAH